MHGGISSVEQRLSRDAQSPDMNDAGADGWKMDDCGRVRTPIRPRGLDGR